MRRRVCGFILLLTALMMLSSCDTAGSGDGTARATRTDYISPAASGESTYASASAVIDYSNASEGYVMVKYTGDTSKIKVQITGPEGTTYTYTSFKGDYVTFPLTEGSGSYRIAVYEHVSGIMYSLVMSEPIEVQISNEFGAFLYPNQYVWFTADSKTVKLGRDLSDKSATDLDYVERVYKYVIKHIRYDDAKADDTPLDYIPDVDETLDTGKGICFDYASLMSAMLRSQGIPTKLVVGYAGTDYHAWISVYLEETGWVDNIIQFNGKDWSLMDPTLGSSNSDESVKEYVNDDSNYKAKYFY